jgi:hypothetical protein
MNPFFSFRFWGLAIGLSTSGCFSLVDVDRFHPSPSSQGGSQGDLTAATNLPGQYSSLKLTLIGMTPHVSQLFEYRIIDANNFVQSRGVVNPLGGANVIINAPLSVPKVNGPFHLDLYADVNGSGGYDGIGSVVTQDHAWRIDPLQDYPAGSASPVDGLVQVTFTHNTSFTEINDYPSGTPNVPHDTGLGATIRVSNAQSVLGALLQVRIVDTGANRTVGLFRLPRITQPAFELQIPGVVENGVDYSALVYVDANKNGSYDDPAMGAGDLGWSVSGAADATGLTVSLDAATIEVAKVDVGPP